MIIPVLVFVLMQAPVVATPPVAPALSAKQVETAATLRAQFAAAEDEYLAAVISAETAAKRQLDAKAKRDRIRGQAQTAERMFLMTLGAKDGDTFDWPTLTVRRAPQAAKD